MAFIVFEGLDGAGKSTLIRGLKTHLQTLGLPSVVTREPGGTPLGEEIRSQLLRIEGDTPVPRAELLLYEAARAQHVDRVIRPNLAQGVWVLCDRFTESTLAFQVGGRSMNEAAVKWLNDYASEGVCADLVVLLDIPVENSLERISKREQENGQTKDRFEMETRLFHQRVRDNYLDQSQAESKRWLVLDGRSASEILLAQLILNLEKKGWLDFSTK
jgi:dTMP kinase